MRQISLYGAPDSRSHIPPLNFGDTPLPNRKQLSTIPSCPGGALGTSEKSLNWPIPRQARGAPVPNSYAATAPQSHARYEHIGVSLAISTPKYTLYDPYTKLNEPAAADPQSESLAFAITLPAVLSHASSTISGADVCSATQACALPPHRSGLIPTSHLF